jgi:hypothetical protein
MRFLAYRIAACAGAAAATACNGGGECGPGDAPADGVTVTTPEGVADSYGGFTSSPNNDCTPMGASVTSISITGREVGGSSFFTVCIPRPDQVGDAPLALGHEDQDEARLVDLRGDLASGCSLSIDRSRPIAATIAFRGWCGDGLDAAGYAIELAGEAPVVVTCMDGENAVTATLGGSAAVEAL